MQQLSGLDATFLNIETATTFGHISGLVIFDPSTGRHAASFDEVKAIIEARMHLLPPYRQRLVEVPFGLDQPYWIEDPDFDIDFHLRHIALPAPGDDRQLAAQVSRIVSRPLDRRRPLWELYIIDGLESGHVAQLTKIHHACIDGVSGAELLANLLDLSPEPRHVDPPETPWRPDPVPTELEMLGRGLLSLATKPVKGFQLMTETARNVGAIARAVETEVPVAGRLAARVRGDELLSQAATRPPRSPFNGLIGPHRTFGFTTIELAAVKKIKDSFGVTINDVVMTLCATSARDYLMRRSALPDEPLIAMVPVSVRGEDEQGTLGNQVATMTCSLHTHVDDPIQRLDMIHESMSVAKDTHRALPASLLQDFAQFSPPAVAARAARAIARASARGWGDLPYNLVVSNVPGPQFPLYGAGAQMVANYPVSAIHDGVGLNMTVQSYDGRLDFGLVGCRDLVDDIWELVDGLQSATKRYGKLAKKARKAAKKPSARGES